MPKLPIPLLGILLLLVCLPLTTIAGPTLSSPLNAPPVCSGTPFIYIPNSASPQVGYSWSRAAVPGISNPPATGEGAIDETLINTTNAPITVTYVYTLYSQGATNTENVTVTVNPLPVPDFTAGNTCVNQSNAFINTSTGTGTLSYAWDFGDGATSTSQNPTHPYSAGGTFPVSLTVTDANGCSAATTNSVTAFELPVPGFASTMVGYPAPGEYTVEAWNTSMGGSSVVTGYNWSFNGTPLSGQYYEMYTYTGPSPYTASLTVTTVTMRLMQLAPPSLRRYMIPGAE